jgi:hypothetical protein
VRLPAGAKVKSAPQPGTQSSAFGSIKVDVETTGAIVHVHTTIASTRSRVAASEYAAFRAWCEQVDRLLGQRIVVTTK